MSKRKKLNRLVGLTPHGKYESYNPLLEEDNRVGRRFGLGLIASVAVNALILGGAGVMANRLTPPSPDAPPVEITLFPTPKDEPKPVATPAPPQVAQVSPPPPPPMEMVQPPPPEPERQRVPERVRPTPPPERVRATPPPVQVARLDREKPILPTPEPVSTPPPPQTKLEEQKPTEVAVKAEATEQRKAEAATSVAQRVAQIPEATTQAKALKSELGQTDAVTAPTRNRSIREPVGASTTVASARKSLAELREEAANAGGGNPVSVSAAGAAAPGSGSVTGARAVPATSASNDRSLSANTASAGNASVLDSTPTRSIRGPIASTGPLSARTKVLQSLSSDAEDSNSFSFVPGGTVTAGKVVGTQGATARGTVITSAPGVAQPQFAGANNGITVATPGGVPIRGPRIASGSPGLAGPRARTAVALGDIGGQQGAPGTFNSALPGGGGVSGSGTGGAGGAGSLQARGGGVAGTGGGTGGGELRAQRSGADAVASSRPGRPRDGAIAANGAAFGAKARGPQLSTTSIGGLEGPSGGAGDVDGTPGGLGRAGSSTGRAGAVDGAATGGSLGAKRGTGGSDTVASSGDGNGRGSAIKEEKTDTSGPGSKLQRSENAIATFKPEPDIPDSMRSEQFATSAGVHVKISESGRATYELTRSSGSSVIDRIVTQTLSRWKWKPAIRNGVATASETDITVSLRVR
jgi:hypothetical protein